MQDGGDSGSALGWENPSGGGPGTHSDIAENPIDTRGWL